MAAIVAGDILLKYSIAAAAGNTTASAPSTSLGDQISTSAWAGGSANDLYDDISGAENAASTVDYRCIFVHNNNGANALANAVVYLAAEVAGGASIAVAADSTATSVLGYGSSQALVGVTETAPGAPITGLTYSSPTTVGTGVALGSIPFGNVKAFWTRRTAANTVALSNDGVTIGVGGDTGSL
jgi:hypothetical protein